MAYLSLYRKWRPQTFNDVVGQEHVVRTLTNALDAGRNSHAYLFAGPRGTGKTTLARLLAKGLNCDNGPTGSPCNACDNCGRIARGFCIDVIEIDGASNRGIDEIRDVREKVKFAPAEGRVKVYIIDEVHMLTPEAFNALLKILEEPPSHVVFIFATTEPHRIPATIVSRCQKFDFRSFTPDEIVAQVQTVADKEGVAVDAGALTLIARHSEGGMRDALGFLDQCAAFAAGEVTESLVAQVLGVVERERLDDLADALSRKDVGGALTLVKGIVDSGRDLRQFAGDAVHYFRDLMLLRAAPESKGLVVLTDEERDAAASKAAEFEVRELLRIVESLGRAESDMRWAQSAQLPLEMALIEWVREVDATDLESLAERLSRLEETIASGEVVGPVTGAYNARQAQAPKTSHAKRAGRMADRAEETSGDGASAEEGRQRVASSERPESDTSGSAVASHPTTREPENRDVKDPVHVEAERVQNSRDAEPDPEVLQNSADAELEPEVVQNSADAELEPERVQSPAVAELLTQVKESWPQVLEGLRAAKHVQQEAFLREGVPGAVEDDTVIVYFSPTHRFHQANMDQEKNRSIVEKNLAKLLGRKLKMRAVLGEPAQQTPSAPTGGSVLDNGGSGSSGSDASETDAHGDEGEKSDSQSSRRAWDDHSGPVDASEIDPNEIDEPILRAALKLFGGTITKLERKEAEQ